MLTLGLAGILTLSFSLAGGSQKFADSNSQQESSNVVRSADSDQQETAIEIVRKDDFEKIYDNLSASYVLTVDIDFGGETINSIGTFQPKSDAPEDEETLNTALAFIGAFGGNGHTLSNIKIDAADKNGVGLFGCLIGEVHG